MPVVKIVPKEHWELLKEYLDGQDRIFIPEELVSQFKPEEQEKIQNLDEQEIEYNFGGEADMWVEIVHHAGHFFFETTLRN